MSGPQCSKCAFGSPNAGCDIRSILEHKRAPPKESEDPAYYQCIVDASLGNCHMFETPSDFKERMDYERGMDEYHDWLEDRERD